MSKLLISQYHNEVSKIINYGGTKKETSIRVAFQNLLNSYCQTRDFLLIPELDYQTKSGKLVYPDGTIKDALRLDWGYWESKDTDDNLDVEIEKKLAKGYPNDNILFEDSQTAVLIQNGQETMRVSIQDIDALDQIINAFINYTRPEVKDFREAIDSFNSDLPTILVTLRDLINQQFTLTPGPSPTGEGSESPTGEGSESPTGEGSESPTGEGGKKREFKEKFNNLLTLCQESINPHITREDVREMMIQHILTEDIFLHIFNESQFHKENNIARQLQEVIDTFFTGSVKRKTLSSIERYYGVIRRTAASIVNHHEKQKFLKAVYENFYQAYNPLAADRLGIVYTPNEIVKFMIESTDFLCHKNFNKLLADPDVEILDPATGTGTFITELIEYLPANKLKYKYQNEIHCNEVAILPYYIANLNIEYTYKQKMGDYEEFNNICFVDTLDHTSFQGKQMDLFAMSLENTERIKRQNDKKISVIIGNPPYNAKQENFNQNNANRSYQSIDNRIKSTYIKEGKAQNQIVLYDMYVRFIRWASDRLNNNGIIAFVTNNSFIDALTFDGFKKVLSEEFSHIYLIDLGGNVRQNPKISGTKHNVFGIQAGVAISLLVKTHNNNGLPCQVFYLRRPEFETAKEKLDFLAQNKLQNLDFTHIIPDKKYNWINQNNNDFDDLLPLIDKQVKSGNSEQAIFKLFSSGLKTQRDEWVYDFCQDNLIQKVQFLITIYQQTLNHSDFPDRNKIKWDSELTRYAERKIVKKFNNAQILLSLYRPFIKQYFYFDQHFNGRTYQWFNIYNQDDDQGNLIIAFSGLAHSKPFSVLGLNTICDLGFIETCQCLPLYTYDDNGQRQENITDWGLEQFREYYSALTPGPSPTGEGSSPTGEGSSPTGEGSSPTGEGSHSPTGEGSHSPTGEGSHSPTGEGSHSPTGEGSHSPTGEEREDMRKDLSEIAGANRKIPPELLKRVRELRKKQTPTEKILWECLRGNRLLGAKFRRQHNIGSYIVDFYCHTAKLVIEIDGKIHDQPLQKDKDQNRDEWLKNQGLTILRINNESIINNLEQTLNLIISYLPSPVEDKLPSPVGDKLPSSVGELPSPVGEGPGVREITKLDIFYYIYAVLHNPKYRQTYELNLKRDFPRIPFYDDFDQWVEWGKKLIYLHINYETITAYPLKRIDLDPPQPPLKRGELKPKLKADKIKGEIILDDVTTLTGIPDLAWKYKLGNRSALEWILDQYKEKKIKDLTIAEKFNYYRFADYKEKVIDLLMRVCTVSVETMTIINGMDQSPKFPNDGGL
jgi:very-short-patch-repair endonuclease/type I restriction-modification system DNA methylase subunit